MDTAKLQEVGAKVAQIKREVSSSDRYILNCIENLSNWLSVIKPQQTDVLLEWIRSDFEDLLLSDELKHQAEITKEREQKQKLQERLTLAEQTVKNLENLGKKQVEEINRLKLAIGFLQKGQKPQSVSDVRPAEQALSLRKVSQDSTDSSKNSRTFSKFDYDTSSSHTQPNEDPKRIVFPKERTNLKYPPTTHASKNHNHFGRRTDKLMTNPFEDHPDVEMMGGRQLWQMFGYALRWATERSHREEPLIAILQVKNKECYCCGKNSTFYYHENCNKSLRVMACPTCGNGASQQVEDDNMDVDQFYKEYVIDVLKAKAHRSRNVSRTPPRNPARRY